MLWRRDGGDFFPAAAIMFVEGTGLWRIGHRVRSGILVGDCHGYRGLCVGRHTPGGLCMMIEHLIGSRFDDMVYGRLFMT